MSSQSFPLVGGSRMRLTRVDACGRPMYGNRARLVSSGFVSVGVTANYSEVDAVEVTNANGDPCVQRPARASLQNLSNAIVFCDVDPDLYTAFTGFPRIIDAQTGATIGFDIDGETRPSDIFNALEVWSDAAGDVACDDAGNVTLGYLLWPLLSGARVSDYEINNGAVSFGLSNVTTKEGSLWGVGPYKVTRDETGTADYLQTPIGAKAHQRIFTTTVPAPEETDGLVPLDDPTGPSATSATAGNPGAFVPAGSVRPANFTALDASTITASPTSAWTTGQHIILGDGSYAHWDGTDWEAGKA